MVFSWCCSWCWWCSRVNGNGQFKMAAINRKWKSSWKWLSLWFFFCWRTRICRWPCPIGTQCEVANAMRHMLWLCDDYAPQFDVVFNASKYKCMCCSLAGAAKQVTPADSLPSFSIESRVIDFVDKWPRLHGSHHNEGVYRYRRHT